VGADEQRLAFGNQLRKARQARDYTLADLAELVDLTVGALSNLERGKRGAREDSVVRLEEALGLPRGELGWFLGYAPAPSTTAPEDSIRADSSIPDDYKQILLNTLATIRTLAPKD
jgi:transcriptional regulator with XRE-family HTH domain